MLMPHPAPRLGTWFGVADEIAAIGQSLCLAAQVSQEPRPTKIGSSKLGPHLANWEIEIDPRIR